MDWFKWVNLGVGLLGLFYLIPPYRPANIGGAIVSIGFLVSFVMRQMYGN